ncbi:hypothetical protein LMG28614_06717 [Paraburkholderia ultramafica]|uniref:Uncharacterized protein n=1 Tax=Paraburkholderia ultramafica TaxID=1544867 RepID=A0A6S7BP10_9BURK|nr:hypothetical protein [Paraburkholderia ultramafica]CAB3808008.1 hypothetical protein LMG28614_06717 [Paraburkholderia ultramafica]
MKEVKLTVRKEIDGSRSLFLLHDQLSEHRAGPRTLAANPDAADFYRRVDAVRKDYEAQGVLVKFSDES